MEKIPSAVSIGTDLELFLFDNEEEAVVPCVGILDGTKDKPYSPKGASKGFAIQEDNVMVEFNIPPCTSYSRFASAVKKGKSMVLKELKERYGSKYGLYTRSHTHKFTAAQLKTPQAQTIGCEPDFNAYEGGSVRVNPPTPGLTRSCGGHIHMGGDFKCPDFVAALFAELFIGLYGRQVPYPKDMRAKWYGKPGIYRPKPYGIEYRTPNNSWAMSIAKTEMVGSLAVRCAKYLTTTPALTLQSHFRAVPWVSLQKYMVAGGKGEKAKELYREILNKAVKAGVPL